MTSFVGRQVEVSRVGTAVVEDPLVTLTGVGGVGKSRLAVEAAAGVRDRFGDGVWLCELAPLNDGTAVGHALAAALGVQQRHGLSIEQTVIEYLRGRELLLVLDNCEHVLDSRGPAGGPGGTAVPDRHGAGHQPGGARRRG